MPLLTVNIDEARTAYAALELRTTAAELNVVNLKASLETLSASHAEVVERANLLTRFTVAQAQSNAQLAVQQGLEITPDISLNDFIGSLGLAAALGEASMPDRAVTSLKASLEGYLSFGAGAAGAAPTVGLRMYQPELGQPVALASTSFEMAKTPPQPGVAAPRSLYVVLQDKQAAFTDPFWNQFVTGQPPAHPAADLVTEIAKIYANIGAWTFPFLIAEAAAIAALETTLAALASGSAPAERVAAYAAVVAALSALATALNPSVRANFVAGDLYALTAALDATTKLANSLHQ